MVLLIISINIYEDGAHSKIDEVQEKEDFSFDNEMTLFEK